MSKKKLKMGSLFAGIGGFDLAALWVDWELVFQVEIDDWCRQVLKKRFPGVKQYADIKNFNGYEYKNTIDVISGGFPCQPFSVAGKRQGDNDHRAIWFEMYRVIQEIAPKWVVAENVDGLTTMEDGKTLETILSQMEIAGFQSEIYNIPAASVQGWHRRNRIWIVSKNTNCC